MGINSAVSSEGQGIGFAIPINVAREILEQLRATGHVTRGYLGIQLQELDPDLQKLLGLRDAKGAVVLEVIEGGAGEAAGLKRYDVITTVSGRGIEDGDQLVRTIAALKPGSPVTLGVVRDGKALSFDTRLSERQDDEEHRGSGQAPDRHARVARRRARARGRGHGPARPQRAEHSSGSQGSGGARRGGPRSGHGRARGGRPHRGGQPRAHADAAAYRKVLATLAPGQSAWLFVYRPRPAGSFLTRVEVEKRR